MTEYATQKSKIAECSNFGINRSRGHHL